LAEKLECENIHVCVEKVDGTVSEYCNIKFPKLFGRVFDYYLYDTDPVFFPEYEYFTLSKNGVAVRHAVFQTGTSDPHTVLFPDLMLTSEMGGIKRVKWSGSNFSYSVDLIEVVHKRSASLKVVPRYVNKKPIVRSHSIDLRPMCPPIADQGDLGTCGVSALTSFLEFISGRRLSSLFVYYTTRVMINGLTPENDFGIELIECIQALAKFGICREETWPYISQNFMVPPPPQALLEAKNFCIDSSNFKPLRSMDEMKQMLRTEVPFVMDVDLTAESYGNNALKTGFLDPPPSRIDMCPHSVLVVGFNDEDRVFYVQNSWGDKWGLNGFGLLPYEYITESHFSNAFGWGSSKPNIVFGDESSS